MILGGLNEGTWPPDVAADPWMSRPMREDFGLPLPERRIGLSAHDFVQACAAPRVALTRAERVQGTPTVPSRWLQRLDNLLLALEQPWALDRGGHWTAWQQALDRPERIAPIARPAPVPPVSARPRRLSVTAIGTWMRDPYAIYARAVLDLKALDPIDADPGAADRGIFIHEALDRFLHTVPAGETADGAYRRLVEIGRAAFGEALSRPGVWAFWWPRFLRIARGVVDEQEKRRGIATPLAIEGWGELVLPGPAGDFTLVAKADRIDHLASGKLAVIDYKTGAPPRAVDMESGHEPQLPLEAAMAARGGFAGVPPSAVAELAVWRLSGGATAGEIKEFDAPMRLAEEAYAGLLHLIETYDDPATPYPAQPRADMAPRYSDYDHLARVKEWSAGAAENGNGDE
jgi:ATP-dependent helicase/nuclease subunit B